ncbi:hypothetical protein AVEN_76773-1 [Araneus ventricosus]|uniref:Reverse transcriptase/retrotransposon-derived protein RNase H-like domain-containing protein n=1 Tax=Araneus ventricosus TaxID=182803 RepID=A0A4Y2B0N9_ARAVE|nr:hypothetical protein AVEN_76773-1 [Araneus ventricosus]
MDTSKGNFSFSRIRSILGLYTYYLLFVRKFPTIARPLHKLNEAKSNFNWGEECGKSFTSQKQALTARVLTYHPIDKRLDTDASVTSDRSLLSEVTIRAGPRELRTVRLHNAPRR